jgi:hypothetical protein
MPFLYLITKPGTVIPGLICIANERRRIVVLVRLTTTSWMCSRSGKGETASRTSARPNDPEGNHYNANSTSRGPRGRDGCSRRVRPAPRRHGQRRHDQRCPGRAHADRPGPRRSADTGMGERAPPRPPSPRVLRPGLRRVQPVVRPPWPARQVEAAPSAGPAQGWGHP